jgi:hypothetical protein
VHEQTQEKGIYDEGDIMKAKLALLRNTNMVDFAMDIHKSLYEGSPVPPGMKERRAEVVGRLRQLQQEEDKACLCVKQQQQQQQQEEQQKVEACLPAGPHTSPDTKRQLLSDLEDALSRPNQMPSNKNTLRLLATPNARGVVDGSTGWIMLSKVRY